MLYPLIFIDVPLLPFSGLRLNLEDPTHIEIIKSASLNDSRIAMFKKTADKVSKIGALAKVDSLLSEDDSVPYEVLVIGEERLRLTKSILDKKIPQAQAVPYADIEEEDNPDIVNRIMTQMKNYGELKELEFKLTIKNTKLSYVCSVVLPLEDEQRQGLLESQSENERLLFISEFLREEISRESARKIMRDKAATNGHHKH